MINTHSDSSNADLLSFIPDIHCLSVWLVTSDCIYPVRIDYQSEHGLLLFSRVSRLY